MGIYVLNIAGYKPCPLQRTAHDRHLSLHVRFGDMVGVTVAAICNNLGVYVGATMTCRLQFLQNHTRRALPQDKTCSVLAEGLTRTTYVIDVSIRQGMHSLPCLYRRKT